MSSHLACHSSPPPASVVDIHGRQPPLKRRSLLALARLRTPASPHHIAGRQFASSGEQLPRAPAEGIHGCSKTHIRKLAGDPSRRFVRTPPITSSPHGSTYSVASGHCFYNRQVRGDLASRSPPRAVSGCWVTYLRTPPASPLPHLQYRQRHLSPQTAATASRATSRHRGAPVPYGRPVASAVKTTVFTRSP